MSTVQKKKNNDENISTAESAEAVAKAKSALGLRALVAAECGGQYRIIQKSDILRHSTSCQTANNFRTIQTETRFTGNTKTAI